jgi:hypothetical protein
MHARKGRREDSLEATVLSQVLTCFFVSFFSSIRYHVARQAETQGGDESGRIGHEDQTGLLSVTHAEEALRLQSAQTKHRLILYCSCSLVCTRD